MDELQNDIQKSIEQHNRQGQAEFEGLSPLKMQYLLTDFFNSKCPVQMNILPEDEYLEIPLIGQLNYLLQLIAESGELKLTKTGKLPVKVVAALYGQGYLKDRWIEEGYAKVYNEDRIPGIIVSRLLLELSPLVKKRNNKLSLTKKGSEILKNNRLLFQEVFKVSVLKYNWAFLDHYLDEHSGQFGFAFSLLLLHKYGRTERTTDFYAEKYFRAFPMLLENTGRTYPYSYEAYSFRTFEFFLKYYGLVELGTKSYPEPLTVCTTPLFHRLIKMLPPTED